MSYEQSLVDNEMKLDFVSVFEERLGIVSPWTTLDSDHWRGAVSKRCFVIMSTQHDRIFGEHISGENEEEHCWQTRSENSMTLEGGLAFVLERQAISLELHEET